MRQFKLLLVALVATCAFGGITASSSLGAIQCLHALPQGWGNFQDPQCTVPGTVGVNGWYIRVIEPGNPMPGLQGVLCAQTNEENTGAFGNAQCTGTEEISKGKFMKVNERPHYWVNGKQLKQGSTKQIKFQLKGGAVLKTPSLALEIECKNSISEGGTIEGSDLGQGQGKGRVTYSQCKVIKPEKAECTVAEPITTSQLKSYLATSTTQTKLVSVFLPTEGTLFTELKFSKGCGVALEGARGVNGSIAAELIPALAESQEGLIVFPQTAITKVIHEGGEVTLGLKAIGAASSFTGAYGARLATNEPFGVYGNN